MVYITQGVIGRPNAVQAAIGIGGGSWKDYVNENGDLVMTAKISGDNKSELSEIYQAWILWADNQKRFESVEEVYGGLLYKGSTNIWLSNDGNFVKMILVQDSTIIDEISSQLGDL